MAILTKEQIEAAKRERPRDEVLVPELGGSVLIQGLTAREVVEFQAAVKKSAKKKGGDPDELLALTMLASRSMIGEDGARLYSDEDAMLLAEMNAAAITRISGAAMRLNQMRPQDIQELVGN